MRYTDLFVGRTDVYARALGGDKGYNPIWDILTPEVVSSHLKGDQSIGIYLIRPPDLVKCMVIDIDQDDEPLVKHITEKMVQDVPDSAILIERTGGKGWHIWVFVDDWIPAKSARALLRRIIKKTELRRPLEIYPRQDSVKGGGLGNLIRIPLGVHQKTGNPGKLYNAFLQQFDPAVVDGFLDLPIRPVSAELITDLAHTQIQGELDSQAQIEPDGPKILPCIEAFQKGVGEGARDEATFRLAAYLHRQQIPKDAALLVLKRANGANRPPMGEDILLAKLDSAYSGAGYGLPCSSPVVGLDSPYCSSSCPVYSTAKAKEQGGVGGTSRSPRLFERDGQYVFSSPVGKDGMRETVLSNFSMRVVSRLEMPNSASDVMRVQITSTGGRDEIMDIPVSAFSSRATLIKELVRAEYAWYGLDVHSQYLKAYLSEQEFPTQKAVIKLGRASTPGGDVWIMPDGILAKNGLSVTEDWTYHRPPYHGTVAVSLPSVKSEKEHVKKCLTHLMSLNEIKVMVPVIGWAMSVPFKPFLLAELGHFPILMLYGTRGAGKTQLIQKAVLPLFGYSSREPQIHFCDTTRFVLVSYGASTTTVPLFFDEYRPSALGSVKVRQLWDHWRHLYAEDTDHRGQADLTRIEFKQSSPVIIAGEERVSDPAMQERMVQVALSPDALTPARRYSFKSLPPLEGCVRSIIEYALNADAPSLLKRAESRVLDKWEGKVSPRIYDNLLITTFGLEVWSDICEEELDERLVANILDESIMVESGGGTLRTSLWVDDFILDVAHMVQEKGPFSWGIIAKEDNVEYLYFNLRRAHAEWSRDMRSRGETTPGMEPIKRQLAEDTTSAFVVERSMQKRMPGQGNMRVYKIDLDMARSIADV